MYYPLIMSMNKATVDADAQLFITNAGITDTTQKSAINTLVKDLKTYGIWSKMKALYPFVGGTAAQHRFNLKDPRAVAGAFYLDFVNGWTHSDTGAKPNGTDGYADTKFNPSTQGITTASAHLSYYSRTAGTTSDGAEMGNYSTLAIGGWALQAKSSSGENRYYYDFLRRAFRSVSTYPLGLNLGSSVSNTRRDIYSNGSSVGNSTSTDTLAMQNFNIYIGGGNVDNTSVGSLTNAESAFASIGTGLTSGEVSSLYTAVQKFNTILNRQV
jgi:hypothetical protein